jgi:hypothetical protein
MSQEMARTIFTMTEMEEVFLLLYQGCPLLQFLQQLFLQYR